MEAFAVAVRASGKSIQTIAAEAGLGMRGTYYAYNSEVSPRLGRIIAMLGAVGLELVVREITIPEDKNAEDRSVEQPQQRVVPQHEWHKPQTKEGEQVLLLTYDKDS